MDLTLTDEQQLMQDTARELLASRSPMSHVRAMESDPTGYSPELWKEMVELGWTGLALPEEYGGVGLSFLDVCLLVEELGRAQTPTPFVPTAVLCAFAVLRFGTEEQKRAYLAPIAAGEKLMSYGHAGPSGGWDPGGSGVTASRDGDGYVLDGTLMFVPYANAADNLIVVARSQEGADGALTAFIVDASASGVSREPLQTVRAERQHRVELVGVRVASTDVLGGDDGGRGVAETIAQYGAAAACAEMAGGAQRVLDMTVEHAQQRQQFGRAVGSFQAVQHHCSNMAMDVLSSRLIAYEAIWRLSEGMDASEEVSLAKAWVSDAYRRVCALGHQVHGAIGFTHEYDLHYFYRHAMSAELSFGDGEYHTERVAEQLGL